MINIKKQNIVTLDIEDLAYGGMGVAKPDNFVVFVKHALPGDRVRARIIKKQKNHANAVIESIERASERRVEAPCPLFGTCGGCSWQHLSYEDQLAFKQRQVAETIAHLSGLADLPPVSPIIPSPEVWHYRNKMEYSFGRGADGQTILGFHVPERYDRIFEVPACLIHPPEFDALLAAFTDYAREHGLDAYDQKTHTKFLRHAVMRHSKYTGGIVVALITAPGELPEPERLAAKLKERCPQLQGFLWGVNRKLADVATYDEERFRWGHLELEERINGLTFKISPLSFFQTNTLGAEKLYQAAVDMAELEGGDRVLDAYCGAGAIGLHCASRAGKVVGVDIVRDAIWNARENAKLNGIVNATFLSGPMNERLSLARQTAGEFTRVIIDPPRGGMDKKSLAMLVDLQAAVFVYVSCNPSTLARDLKTIAEGGYKVEAIQPVDMFPHTYHIEAVVKLRRAS